MATIVPEPELKIDDSSPLRKLSATQVSIVLSYGILFQGVPDNHAAALLHSPSGIVRSTRIHCIWGAERGGDSRIPMR